MIKSAEQIAESLETKEHTFLFGFEDAIKNKEFKVYFQPKFNINANKFNGAEALVRWQKPDGTIISPGMFIPLFEKNGDIVKLDKYVLEETCAKIRKWPLP